MISATLGGTIRSHADRSIANVTDGSGTQFRDNGDFLLNADRLIGDDVVDQLLGDSRSDWLRGLSRDGVIHGTTRGTDLRCASGVRASRPSERERGSASMSNRRRSGVGRVGQLSEQRKFVVQDDSERR